MAQTTETLQVRGMACRPCEDAISAGLLALRGVRDAEARYWKGDVTVRYDPAVITHGQIVERLEQIGYPEGRSASGAVTDIACLVAVFAVLWLLQHLPLGAAPTADSGASYGFLFVIGLLTSVHCLAMCGGILLTQTTDEATMLAESSLAGSGKTRSKHAAVASLSYNVGRVVAYTIAGAVFGAAGTVLVYTPTAKAVVFLIAGTAVIIVGLRLFGILPPLVLARFGNGGSHKRAHRRLYGKTIASPLAVGLLTGMMPCGALAAMWLFAMSTGSAAQGALSMLSFAAGTVPAMFLLGAFSSLLPRRWLRYLLRIGAILVIALGLSMALKGLMML